MDEAPDVAYVDAERIGHLGDREETSEGRFIVSVPV